MKNIFLLHHQNFFLSTPPLLPLLPPQQWSLVQLQHLCMTFPHPYFYRPQRSCGKVMFLHLSVSHSIYRGVSGRHSPGGHRPGRHPRFKSHLCRSPPLKQMTTAADGTHPTGIHFCLHLCLQNKSPVCSFTFPDIFDNCVEPHCLYRLELLASMGIIPFKPNTMSRAKREVS